MAAEFQGREGLLEPHQTQRILSFDSLQDQSTPSNWYSKYYFTVVMRLTSFTDFGLRALMYIASTPNQSASTAELAREFGLSRHHLVKIVQRLSSGGILTTRRGGGGGASLTRPAEEIRLGDLVRLLEEGQPLVECFSASGGACSIRGCCRLRQKLRAAEAAFLAELDCSTLADIALLASASELRAPVRLDEQRS